jgi:hypothetical protein
MGKDFEDAEELKEILSVVSTEIPKLIEAITKTMYNQENAQNMAKSVAEFYKSMKAAGMDDKMAYELTQEFMSSFSLGSMISKAIQGGSSNSDEIDDMIEEKIKRRVKEKLEEKEKAKDDE